MNKYGTKIEAYTKANSELWSAHHFGYPRFTDDSPKLVVIAMNPGENPLTREIKERLDNTPPEADASYYAAEPTHGYKTWHTKVKRMIGTDSYVMSQAWFWSSATQRLLEKRWGNDWMESKHFDKCAEINKELIADVDSPCVVVLGLSMEAAMTKAFSLGEQLNTIYSSKGHRLAHDYLAADGRRFVIATHPCVIGQTTEDRLKISDFINNNC